MQRRQPSRRIARSGDQRAFISLEEAQRESARTLIVRLFEHDEHAGSGALPLSAVMDQPDVLSALAGARLVSVTENGIVPAHGRLVREWPRYRGWLAEGVGRRDGPRPITVGLGDSSLVVMPQF